MLDNLKLVLLQHKRFLTIFLFIIFIPSLFLAFFGIRAINNERYKLQQINLEQQRGFVRAFKAEVQSLIERELSGIRELSTSRALLEGDYRAFSGVVLKRLQEEFVLGQVVLWNGENPAWFPILVSQPLAGQSPAVPAEWRLFQSDLKRAEKSELRLRNFSEAISLYRRILQRSSDNQVKAWILSRIARCEVKQNNYEQAVMIRRSVIADFPDLLTESGRSLEIATRMAILDDLWAENNIADFFSESLQTLEHLDEKFWSFDPNQIQVFMAELFLKVDETVGDNSLDIAPGNYQSSMTAIRNLMDSKLEIWRMAEDVKGNLLPNIRDRIKDSPEIIMGLQKNSLEVEGKDVLALLMPLVRQKSEIDFEFIGSLLTFENLNRTIDTFIRSNAPQGISLLVRSNLSNRVLYGEEETSDQIPVLTDFFSENFPPWKLEAYQKEGISQGLPLYKNIFFWIILALMVIVFFGSGLIIRTIIQEVNLLNLKSEFIASVSHEFKTPLTAMGAILERLLSGEVSDSNKIREYHRILSHDSEKLRRLVKNVLDFSKIEDGKREYKLAKTDIPQLIRKEVDSFQEENKMAGFDVEVKIEDDIPLALADEEALSQALHNILDNAAKFSGTEKRIDVSVTRKKDKVEIAVLDRGVGIAEEELKRVFEKFYRGKRASSVSPTGTGLGLTLVKHIMNGHKGSVVVQSQLGKGSRVSLILPLTKGG